MRILVCTHFSLINSSAGLTKMNKVRESLKLYGVKTYISGFVLDKFNCSINPFITPSPPFTFKWNLAIFFKS